MALRCPLLSPRILSPFVKIDRCFDLVSDWHGIIALPGYPAALSTAGLRVATTAGQRRRCEATRGGAVHGTVSAIRSYAGAGRFQCVWVFTLGMWLLQVIHQHGTPSHTGRATVRALLLRMVRHTARSAQTKSVTHTRCVVLAGDMCL